MVGENSNARELSVELEVEVESLELLEKFFGGCEPRARHVFADSRGSFELIDFEEGIGFADVTTATLLVTFAIGVGTGVVANVIYDAIGAGLRRLTADKRRVRPTRKELEQALETVKLLASEQDNADPENGKD